MVAIMKLDMLQLWTSEIKPTSKVLKHINHNFTFVLFNCLTLSLRKDPSECVANSVPRRVDFVPMRDELIGKLRSVLYCS
jgi:hypothetical protein